VLSAKNGGFRPGQVAHNAQGTTPTPWPPHVVDAHETYAGEA
jgi:hypothetical protein